MLTAREIPDTNIFEISVDGSITRTEFDAAMARLERMIAQHGSIRLIEIIHGLGGIAPSALWEDLRLAPRNLKHLDRVAVVADQAWIEWMATLARPFVHAEMRTFPLDQLEQARTWIESA